jgi:hypothetical protein
MIEDASPNAESEVLRVVSNWSLELRNPAAIQLQSRAGEPISSRYGPGRGGIAAEAR